MPTHSVKPRSKVWGRFTLVGMLCLIYVFIGCKSRRPRITFTNVPEVSPGGPDTKGIISGRVSGSEPGDRLVLLARSGDWWVQPDIHAPVTTIAADGSWTTVTHLGKAYGALLVSAGFRVKERIPVLPSIGKDVRSTAEVAGTPSPIDTVDHPSKPLKFGGFAWRNDFRVGSLDYIHRYYLPENAEVDERGALHLRIRTIGNQRTCAQVNIGQTLGYGDYSFRIIVPPQIDPAAELDIFTSSSVERPGEHREIEFHLSRWGDPQNANAEYVIQPYHVAANVHHFELEPGPVTTHVRWSPGRADFVSRSGRNDKEITRWSFTSGIPAYKNQRFYLNFCPFGYPKVPFSRDAEITLDSFEFLP